MGLLTVHSGRLAMLENAPVDVPKSRWATSPVFEIYRPNVCVGGWFGGTAEISSMRSRTQPTSQFDNCLPVRGSDPPFGRNTPPATEVSTFGFHRLTVGVCKREYPVEAAQSATQNELLLS